MRYKVYEIIIDDKENVLQNTFFQDKPSPLSLEVYDKDSLSISGTSLPFNWGKFRMRFGRESSSSGELPLSFSKYFSLGSSWFTDSVVNWDSLNYGITLNMAGKPLDTPSYFSQFSSGDEIPGTPYWIDDFTPRSYTKYAAGSVSPFGIGSAHQIGYSDAHSWSYWLGVPNGNAFSTDSASNYYFRNYAALLDASDTIVNLDWSMGDNESDLWLTLDSSDTLSFSSAYSSALSTGMQDFTFGLSLNDNALSNLESSFGVVYDSDSFVKEPLDDGVFSLEVNYDRYYSTPIDPYSWPGELNYGVFYYLIPVDKNGNELSNNIIGPYLFDTGYPMDNLLGLSYDYKVRLALYVRDISLSLSDFRFSSSDSYASEGIPYSLQPSSSNATSSFGTNADLYCQIYNLRGFVVTPTVYADGVTNSDILDNFNSNFTSLKDLLDEGFEVTISGLNSINNNITSSTASINSSIASASTSINNQLVDSTNQINDQVKESTDKVTNGYDNSSMTEAQQKLDSSLKDLDSVEDMEITDPKGNKVSFFDYIKSVFSSWSWPSFTTEFTNALTEISQLLNTIYSSLPEPFQTVIMFLILFSVLSIVLNLYKYYSSG